MVDSPPLLVNWDVHAHPHPSSGLPGLPGVPEILSVVVVLSGESLYRISVTSVSNAALVVWSGMATYTCMSGKVQGIQRESPVLCRSLNDAWPSL